VRIATWNCGMALARKAPSLLTLRPDIAVIQECSKKSVDVLHGHGLSGLWFHSERTHQLSNGFYRLVNASHLAKSAFNFFISPGTVRQVRLDVFPLFKQAARVRTQRASPETTIDTGKSRLADNSYPLLAIIL
jgi:hypothetical protein